MQRCHIMHLVSADYVFFLNKNTKYRIMCFQKTWLLYNTHETTKYCTVYLRSTIHFFHIWGFFRSQSRIPNIRTDKTTTIYGMSASLRTKSSKFLET